jgi:hypothetical protein
MKLTYICYNNLGVVNLVCSRVPHLTVTVRPPTVVRCFCAITLKVKRVVELGRRNQVGLQDAIKRITSPPSIVLFIPLLFLVASLLLCRCVLTYSQLPDKVGVKPPPKDTTAVAVRVPIPNNPMHSSGGGLSVLEICARFKKHSSRCIRNAYE